MKIAIGSDHAGFELKEHLKKHLARIGHDVLDVGTHSRDSVDYPDYGFAVGRAVASSQAERGVVICGSGVGISIAANKVPGVRAGVAADLFTAHLMRAHNDANVIGFGARLTAVAHAEMLLETFLQTAFEGGRHGRRVEKLNQGPGTPPSPEPKPPSSGE